MSQAQKDYAKLHAISKDIKTLRGIASLLSWDQETVMPPEAAGVRAEHLKVISGVIHKHSTSLKFSSALAKLIDIDTGKPVVNGLKHPQKAALKVWRREYKRDTALPKEFVESFAKLTSESIHAWNAAKKDNAFTRFSPYLEKIIHLCRKKADYIGYNTHPYDALLEEFEPGMSTKELKKIFNQVKKGTLPLLEKINKANPVDDTFLYGNFPKQKQLAISEILLDRMGYKMSRGRLDESSHPFSSSCHPHDSRITTRLDTKSFMSNIRTILHEGGHSLYEMGLPLEEYGSPLGEAASFGVHESQSRWWETLIGLSKPFWSYTLPLLKEKFPKQLDSVSLKRFYKGINKVEPSLIRVEADELTYNLHIILRFEIEIALIEGTLSVRDIPDVWNQKMEELLGICPDSNTTGCLQDIHWSLGVFGYFPTYSLGNLYAAQLFEAFKEDHPHFEHEVAQGNISFIKDWLASRVHRHGQRYTGPELIKKATGKPFSPKPFLAHLDDKYSAIYAL